MTKEDYNQFKDNIKLLSLDQLIELSNTLHKAIQEEFRMKHFRNILNK